MKHHLKLLIFFLLISSTAYSQGYFDLSKNHFFKTTIYLTDGTVKKGYIRQFDAHHVFNTGIGTFIKSLKKVETQLGFSNNHYYFRKTKKGKNQKIPFKDIKRIKRMEYNPKTEEFDREQIYDKITLVEVKHDLTLKKLTPFMIPLLFKNDKIAVYGFVLDHYNGRALLGHTPLFYFRPIGSDYAIKPIKFNGYTITNRQKTYKKYLTALKYLGKDCPQFQDQLKSIVPFTQKEFKKRIRKDLKFKELHHQYNKKRKAAKKQYKRKKYKLVRKVLYDYYLQNISNFWYKTYFKDVVDAYSKMCD